MNRAENNSADSALYADTLANFEHSRSAAGRPVCYAREQLRFALLRILLIIAGSLTFFIFANERIAWLGLIICLLTELSEDAYLMWMRRQSERFLASRVNFVLICLFAFVQASGFSLATWMTWLITLEFLPDVTMILFLSVVAAGASYVISHMFWPAILRTIPPAIAAFYIVNFTFANLTIEQSSGFSIFVATTLLIAILTAMLIGAVYFSMRDREKIRRELLASRVALADTIADLHTQAVELRKMATISEQSADPVAIIDSGGLITWINPAFEKTFGFSTSQAHGRTLRQLIGGEETDEKAIAKADEAIRTGQHTRFEIANYTRDGIRIWTEASLNPVLGDEGQLEHVVCIIRDIGNFKQRQSRLVAARFQAEQTARARADILANMSHEIRTPMNGILGMTDLLMQTQLSGAQRAYAEAIESSGRSLLTIINDILDFSKLEAGALEISPVQASVTRVINDVFNLLRPMADAKALKLECEVSDDVPELVMVDEVRLRQILTNLVGNALKFTEEGKVSVSVLAEAGSLILMITDTGIGIPFDKQERIFDQYAQVASAQNRAVRGTGLGLAISRLLARLMGGDVTIAESVPGKGTTFRVSVEFSHVAEAKFVEESGRSSEERIAFLKDQFNGRTVLIAEDNALNATLLETYLSKLGIETMVAVNGLIAVDRFAEHRPFMIFMDVNMPEMNGLDACREIRKMRGEQPLIIALTASAFDQDREACLEAGMDEFLSKPLLGDDLYRKLEQMFEQGVVA